MKVCTKCHIEKDEREYYKRARSNDGLQPCCKKCKNIADRKHCKEWKNKNKGYIKDYNRGYRTKNKAVLSLNRRANKENINRKARDRYAKNPNVHRIAAKKYRESNLEKCKARCRMWSSRNKEKVKEQHAKWHAKNYERIAPEARRRSKLRAEALGDLYVIDRLKQNGFDVRALKDASEVIEYKRILLKFKRSLKNKNYEKSKTS